MTRQEAKEVLKYNMEMCRFNPLTGDCLPMNQEAAELGDACEVAIKAIEELDGIEDWIDKRKAGIIQDQVDYGKC